MIVLGRAAAEADRLVHVDDRPQRLVLERLSAQGAQVVAMRQAAAEADQPAALGAAHRPENQLADRLAEQPLLGQLCRAAQVFVGGQVAGWQPALALLVSPLALLTDRL